MNNTSPSTEEGNSAFWISQRQPIPHRMSRYVLVNGSIMETTWEALNGKTSVGDGEGASQGDISERGLDIFYNSIYRTEANGPGAGEEDKEAEKAKRLASLMMTHGWSGARCPGKGTGPH